MTKAEFFNEIEDVLGLEKGTIHSDMVIKGQPFWDSMAIMSFMAMIEEKFSVILNNDQINQAVTFGDLAKILDVHITD